MLGVFAAAPNSSLRDLAGLGVEKSGGNGGYEVEASSSKADIESETVNGEGETTGSVLLFCAKKDYNFKKRT